jgi:hypothetical protein
LQECGGIQRLQLKPLTSGNGLSQKKSLEMGVKKLEPKIESFGFTFGENPKAPGTAQQQLKVPLNEITSQFVNQYRLPQ